MFTKFLVVALGAGTLIGIFLPSEPSPTPAPAPLVVATQNTNPAAPVAPLETILPRQSNGHFYADALVNGQMVHFLVDTGASGIALTSEDAARVGLQDASKPAEVVGQGASGDVIGRWINIHHIALDQKEAFDMRGVEITQGLGVSLLGQSFLAQIGSVTIKGDQMILR